jgi:hypothetical protein
LRPGAAVGFTFIGLTRRSAGEDFAVGAEATNEL